MSGLKIHFLNQRWQWGYLASFSDNLRKWEIVRQSQCPPSRRESVCSEVTENAQAEHSPACRVFEAMEFEAGFYFQRATCFVPFRLFQRKRMEHRIRKTELKRNTPFWMKSVQQRETETFVSQKILAFSASSGMKLTLKNRWGLAVITQKINDGAILFASLLRWKASRGRSGIIVEG